MGLDDMDLVARAAREALYDFQHGDDNSADEREHNVAGELYKVMGGLQRIVSRKLYRATYNACHACYMATIYREQKA